MNIATEVKKRLKAYWKAQDERDRADHRAYRIRTNYGLRTASAKQRQLLLSVESGFPCNRRAARRLLRATSAATQSDHVVDMAWRAWRTAERFVDGDLSIFELRGGTR